MATNRLEKPFTVKVVSPYRPAQPGLRVTRTKAEVKAAIDADPFDHITTPYQWLVATYGKKAYVAYTTDDSYVIVVPAMDEQQEVVKFIRNKGWDSNANSVDILYGDGYFEWSGYSASGQIVVGITPITTSGDSMSMKDATHAFKIKKNSSLTGKTGIRYLHKGQRTKPKTPVPRTKSTVMPRYRITRVSSEVYFSLINGDGVVLELYKSKIRSTTPVMLDVSMYNSGDFVDYPVMVTPESDSEAWDAAIQGLGGLYTEADPDPELPAMVCIASNQAAAATNVSIPKITCVLTLSEYTGAITTFPRIHGMGSDHPVSDIISDMPEISAYAIVGDEFAVPTTWADSYSYIHVTAAGLVSEVTQLSMDASLPPLDCVASDYEYAQIIANTPRITCLALEEEFPEGMQFVDNVLGMSFVFLLEGSIEISVDFSLGFATAVTVATVLQEEWYSTLGIGDSHTLLALLNAVHSEHLQLSDVFTIPQTTDIQYAVDADTGIVTTYRAFGFNSFAEVGGETYALKDDGLYRMRAGDDDGELRGYHVDFGGTEFSDNQWKNLDSVWFGVSTDSEQIYAKVIDDAGNEYIYGVVQTHPTSRAVCGRGLTSKKYTLRLDVVDAEEFYLDSVEFSLAASSRRRVP